MLDRRGRSGRRREGDWCAAESGDWDEAGGARIRLLLHNGRYPGGWLYRRNCRRFQRRRWTRTRPDIWLLLRPRLARFQLAQPLCDAALRRTPETRSLIAPHLAFILLLRLLFFPPVPVLFFRI